MKIVAVSIILIILLFSSCQSLQHHEISRENEITKQIRLFSTEVVRKIYKLKPLDSKVLIMDFTDPKKQFTYLGTYISDKLSEEIVGFGNLKLVNRANTELIMNELSFQQSGLVSEEDILRIGNFSGANILITGIITDLGDELDVSIDVTEIEKSESEPASFRITKTTKTMGLISAIIEIEEKKERELKEEIERLQGDITERKQELERLLIAGLKEVEEKLIKEEDQKRRELNSIYDEKKKQILVQFRAEEERKKRELAYIEQQIREKSKILAVLEVKKRELRTYEDMIENIRAGIARRNNVIQNYIYTGMNVYEVSKALGVNVSTIAITMAVGHWNDVFKSYCVSYHGDFVIVWSDMLRNPKVIGFCNIQSGGKCWSRSAGK